MEMKANAPRVGAGAPVPFAELALQVINGEQQAHEYLARLHAQHSEPDELARMVAALAGAKLSGLCRVIVRAIGGAP